MITTVTLNPAIDRSYIINNFKPNNNYRIDDVTVTVGGKGINVARTVSALGEKLNATGFLGGITADYIKKQLNDLGIATSFVKINDESRNFTAIIDPINRTETTVNEVGPFVSKTELTKFIKEYIKILKYSKIIIASGSVPKGVPKTIYRDMVKIAKDNNVLPIIDASGKFLEEAIKAKPYMIKPNLKELRELVGYELNNEYEIIHESKYICKQGVGLVVISLGSKGAIFTTREKVIKVEAPNIKAVNTVGSGDALVAGFAVALVNKFDLDNAFRYGIACGAANTLEKGIANIKKETVERLFSQVKLTRLE